MRVLVTGGAGFIGSHLVRHLTSQGDIVAAIDNLSRLGSGQNLEWVRESVPTRIEFFEGDVRDGHAVREIVGSFKPEIIYHLAAQVAVTSSVKDPSTDFEINACGTLNVLEAARRSGAAVLFTSTNKVYGELKGLSVVTEEQRYAYAPGRIGVSEGQALDFQSPYGCSKGAADQYVLDYGRIYGISTVVFRLSCIYGTHQFGNEDQGWLSHFVIAAVLGRSLTIYGDGRQVRDVLFIDDLLTAFDRARTLLVAGGSCVFNIGGGPAQAISVWREFGPMLARLLGRPIEVTYGPWRPGDQRIFVSDIRKAERELYWRPVVSVEEGLGRVFEWVSANRELCASMATA